MSDKATLEPFAYELELLKVELDTITSSIRQMDEITKDTKHDLDPYWEKLRKMKTAGSAIGHVERPIFFAALWITNGWPILSSWLVFKLAYYWQSANFTAFPLDPPNKEQGAWLVAKRQLGTHHVATALVGTGANIVLALVGVAVGKWIRFQ